jgi:2-dehydro-3-deoxygluconokinase
VTVIKNGPRPVRVRTSDEAFEVEVPALDVVADSTGAGDAFAGGYLAATIRGAPIRSAVQLGIDVAARALRR